MAIRKKAVSLLALASLLLAVALPRAARDVVRRCAGQLEVVPVTPELKERAARLPAIEPTAVPKDPSASTGCSGHIEGGSFDDVATVGPLTLHDQGTYYRMRAPSHVSVSMTDGCDDVPVVHDPYTTGHVEGRHDEGSDLWFVVTRQSGDLSRVTAVRAVRAPRRIVSTATAIASVLAAGALVVAFSAALRVRRSAASGERERMPRDERVLRVAALVSAVVSLWLLA